MFGLRHKWANTPSTSYHPLLYRFPPTITKLSIPSSGFPPTPIVVHPSRIISSPRNTLLNFLFNCLIPIQWINYSKWVDTPKRIILLHRIRFLLRRWIICFSAQFLILKSVKLELLINTNTP